MVGSWRRSRTAKLGEHGVNARCAGLDRWSLVDAAEEIGDAGYHAVDVDLVVACEREGQTDEHALEGGILGGHRTHPGQGVKPALERAGSQQVGADRGHRNAQVHGVSAYRIEHLDPTPA